MLKEYPYYLVNLLITGIIIAFSAISLFSHLTLATNLPVFLLLVTLIQIMCIGVFFYAKKTPGLLSNRKVLFLGVLVSCIGVAGQPIFEDDYFRYLWDAYVFHFHGTPYGMAPEVFFSDSSIPDHFQEILGYINHPSLPTLYGPTLQYSFLLAFMIDPGNVWILQLIYALANLIIIVIGLKFSAPHYVLLYVFSPLVFKEVLLTAHPDGLAVTLLLVACWAKYRSYYFATGCFLALSIGAKVFAILFIPFLILRQPLKVALGLLLTLSLLYFPLAKNGASDLMGLTHMASHWEFNSALWGVSRVFLSVGDTRVFMAMILITVLGWYGWSFYRQQQYSSSILPRGDIILGCFLVCAPVINPWYLLWVLPFAVIWPSVTAWFAGFIVFLSYLVPIYLPSLTLEGNYDQPLVIRWVEFGLLALVFIVECYWRKRGEELTSRV